jgi:hypothetical protein
MSLIDTELTKGTLSKIASTHFPTGRAVTPGELPLIGLCFYLLGLETKSFKFPTAPEIGKWLSEQRSLQVWVFTLYVARKLGPALARMSLEHAATEMRKAGTYFSIAEGMNNIKYSEMHALLATLLA